MNSRIAISTVLLVVATLTAGCGHDFTLDVENPPIAVAAETVTATVNSEGYLTATVEATYTNRTGQPTFLWHYMGLESLKYIFQKNLDGEWPVAWSGGGPLGEYPVKVAPGDTFTSDLSVYDDTTRPAADRNFLHLPEAGEYRAAFFVTTDSEGNHEVPLTSRVSTPFQLTVE